MTLRAMGAYNGMLPEATGMIVAFMTDPANMPYLQYTQLVPAPEVVFEYWKMDPDDATRLPDLNTYAWGYDDPRPSGEGFKPRGEMVPARIQRWDFPYTVGNTTIRTWGKGLGVDPRAYLDSLRMGHAHLHRAVRIVNALANASWGANTSTPTTLLGQTAYFDQSSGTELDPTTGAPNPNFQVIKRTFQKIKRFIHLSTNSALKGDELCAVIPPVVANAIATAGEIVEFVKQSVHASQLMSPNIVNWNLPEYYGGFKLVVEDTPRCFIKMKADGTTVADVSVAAQKDYILDDDNVYFCSRPGQLKGIAGAKSYSTVQLWHYGGEARVEAFTEPKHDLVEGHVVLEDKVLTPALLSGFALTDVLAP